MMMNHLVKFTRYSSKYYLNKSNLFYNFVPQCWLERTILSNNNDNNNRHLYEPLSKSCRNFASKNDSIYEEKSEKKPKYRNKTLDYKQKIFLKDISGRMLGLKTQNEAMLIAKNQRCILIKDDGEIKKIPTFKMVKPRSINSDDNLDEVENISSSSQSSHCESYSESENQEDSSSKKTTSRRYHSKQIILSSAVSDHDIQMKIKNIKKYLLKGIEALVRVNAIKTDDISKLVMNMI